MLYSMHIYIYILRYSEIVFLSVCLPIYRPYLRYQTYHSDISGAFILRHLLTYRLSDLQTYNARATFLKFDLANLM